MHSNNNITKFFVTFWDHKFNSWGADRLLEKVGRIENCSLILLFNHEIPAKINKKLSLVASSLSVPLFPMSFGVDPPVFLLHYRRNWTQSGCSPILFRSFLIVAIQVIGGLPWLHMLFFAPHNMSAPPQMICDEFVSDVCNLQRTSNILVSDSLLQRYALGPLSILISVTWSFCPSFLCNG